MANGHAKIALERVSHYTSRDYSAEHDDLHTNGELAWAACAYLFEGIMPRMDGVHLWPFSDGWKPEEDPVDNLVKAGALIAAEIDRIQRTRTEQPGFDSSPRSGKGQR